jgi:NAD(P)-dependent dehydrogenase (short-subunit alcohol dehydrogenase family)
MEGSMASDRERRVALVTGGTRGIGAAIAKRLAAEGYAVVITARNAPDHDSAGIDFMACDIRKADSAAALVDSVVARHKRLDLLVNNAGGGPEVPSAEASPRLHESVIALNLTAPLHLSQSAYRAMRETAGSGSIVNIASLSGVRPSPGTAAYGAAKAGLLSLTRSLAMEWAPDVRVNALVLGLVQTEAALDHYGGPEGIARVSASVPMGRMARGEDIAELVLFLASDVAAYLTGAEIAVHGGGERPPFLALARGE